MSTASISVCSTSALPVSMRAAWGMRFALGFLLTVVLWGICYFVLMGPGLLVGDLLFSMMCFCILPGGMIAGRWRAMIDPRSNSAVKSGFMVGFLCAFFNLLIVGSMFQEGASSIEVAGWLFGLFAICSGLGAVGGAISLTTSPVSLERIPSPLGMLSAVLASAILLLLMSGGLVTGLEAGLAVPDWPGSFGHNMLLYPMREMTADTGVFFEHAHRLYGMLVGTGALTLLVFGVLNDQRKWIRGLVILLLGMICIQGLMGGLRVTETSTILALVHGVFGQLVFTLALLIAAFTTNRWLFSNPSAEHPAAAADRPFAFALVIFLVGQLIFGACVRHLQTLSTDGIGLEIPYWAVMVHITAGVLIFAIATLLGYRSGAVYRSITLLRRLGLGLLVIVSLQLLLGIVALVAVSLRAVSTPPIWEVIFTSMHQATGALLLGLSALFLIWHLRLVKPQTTKNADVVPAN